MRRITLVLAASLSAALLVACTDLLPGTDFADMGSNGRDPRPDSGVPRDPGADATQDPDPGLDATPDEDAAPPGDGATRDAQSRDADERRDSGDRRDAGDAGDAAPRDAACSAQMGLACSRPGFCGATYGCDGQCRGGVPPPPCHCASPVCQANGQWTACPDPPSWGARCNTATRCGGAIACDNTCQGGNLIPSCHCGQPACQATGQWTACPDPPGYGTRCNTATHCGGTIACNSTCQGGNPIPTCHCNPQPVCQGSGQWSPCSDPAGWGSACAAPGRCGATIACNGACEGGTPLPTCQCGTPTCNGCVGGTCGAASHCVTGHCQCTVNECGCPGGSPSTSCRYCAAGALRTCTVDAYGCGVFSAPSLCSFGCVQGAASCNCSPQQGHGCVVPGGCACDCGDFDRPGTTQCDGTCLGTGTCVAICRSHCGCVPPRCLVGPR